MSSDDALSKFELRIAVRSAIQELPEHQRLILERILDQLQSGGPINVRQLASEVELSYSATYEILGRALVSLRQSLERHPEIEVWRDQLTHAEAALVKGPVTADTAIREIRGIPSDDSAPHLHFEMRPALTASSSKDEDALPDETMADRPKRRTIIPKSVRDDCIAKSAGRCSICGREGVPLEIRHIQKLPEPQHSELGNLQAVCRSCHAMLDRHGMGTDSVREIAGGSYQLELLTREILNAAGGYTVVSGATGPDAGVDIVAKFEVAQVLLMLLVECKWRRKGITAQDVSQFAAKVGQFGAHKGLIVTNKPPTAPAIDVARSFGIAIVTAAELADSGLRVLEGRLDA